MASIIYILLSIKTRIETERTLSRCNATSTFISYYPLKQGLKHAPGTEQKVFDALFISYYPLKQGLKRRDNPLKEGGSRKFISYYPLKQGLKLAPYGGCQ